MLKVNELNKKVTGSSPKNKSQNQPTMENNYNPTETALALIAKEVEDYDDLAMVQAETGLSMAELEAIYYSII